MTDRHGVLRQPGRPLRWAALLVGLLALAATLLAWSGYQGQVNRVVDEAELRARGAAADVDRYVQSHWFTLNAIAANPVFATGDPAQIRPVLEDLATRTLGFDAGMSWIDADGWMQTRSGGYTGPPIDFRDRAHVRRALATGAPQVSSALIGAVNQTPIVGFVVPTFDAGGRLNGLIGSGIRLGDLSMGADTLRYAGGSEVIVVDARGQVIAGPDPVNAIQHVADAFPLDAMREATEGAYPSTVGPFGRGDQLIGFATAPTADWLVLVARPAAEVVGVAQAALVLQVALIVGGSFVAMVLLVWASRRLDDAVQEQTRAYATERETREALERAVAKLEERQHLRDAFVGVMSHELRTPVTTIYGAAKLLRKAPKRDELETLVEDIEEEADRLYRITEDLLVLSRAEHGLVEIRPEPVLAQRLLPAVVADVRRRHPQLQVELDAAPDLRPVSGDEAALRQVLVNLLTNAAKYGDGSPVRITTATEAETVEIRIEDGGPGLPEWDLEPIFELFHRSSANAHRASGTGIGLYVVRQLVDAMGGSVEAYHVQPRGLGFVVRLRAEPAGEGDHAGDAGPAVARSGVVRSGAAVGGLTPAGIDASRRTPVSAAD